MRQRSITEFTRPRTPAKRTCSQYVENDKSTCDSGAGSPLPAAHGLDPSAEIDARLLSVLNDGARALGGRVHTIKHWHLQRVFLAAVLQVDANDHGAVLLGFAPRHITEQVRMFAAKREYKLLSVAAIDADDFLQSLCAFLRPFQLDAVHHWSECFHDVVDRRAGCGVSMNNYLVARLSHTHKLDTATTNQRLGEYIYAKTVGARPGPAFYKKTPLKDI